MKLLLAGANSIYADIVTLPGKMKSKSLEQLKHERTHYKSIYQNASPQGKRVLRVHLRKLKNRIKSFCRDAFCQKEDSHVLVSSRVGGFKY